MCATSSSVLRKPLNNVIIRQYSLKSKYLLYMYLIQLYLLKCIPAPKHPSFIPRTAVLTGTGASEQILQVPTHKYLYTALSSQSIQPLLIFSISTHMYKTLLVKHQKKLDLLICRPYLTYTCICIYNKCPLPFLPDHVNENKSQWYLWWAPWPCQKSKNTSLRVELSETFGKHFKKIL